MAKAKKAAPRRAKPSSAAMRAEDSVLVLTLTWVFTALSVVFAVVAYWRYT